MTINRSRLAIDIEGLPEMPISGLRISDVLASAKIGMKAFNTVAMELHNVQIDAEEGPVFLIRDSEELELNAVSTRKPPPQMPVIRLDHCPDAVLRDSRAFAGTGTFLSVAPGALKNIALQGNALGAAQKAAEETAKEFPMIREASYEKN